MPVTPHQIQQIAISETAKVNKSFADRMALKLMAKSVGHNQRRQFETAKALIDMAEVFKSEGWNHG